MMLHRFPLPYPWGAVTFLELIEPTRATEEGQHFQKNLYLVDCYTEGGKKLWRRGSEYLIKNPASTGGPVQ